ncbi:MAG: polyprenyl synthetase family protein [Bacteroidaceae bacterium]|nr:polyprenyl synthetase family protein [Bacteroidaceae bacterium]
MNQQTLITAPIESELRQLVALMRSSLSSDYDLLGQVLDHVRRQTGKMMRPILALLMAKCHGGVTEKALHAAASLELLHTASLVHDDVVDNSRERRGQPSVNAVFDNRVSVLTGDYLLSTSLLHGSLTGDVEIIRLISQLGQCLAEGELLQLSNVSNEAISEETYFQIIRKKTAVLFETCAQVGALSAGASPERVEWARSIGEIIGIAFQVKDDIFDYTSSAAAIGKPVGNDMREGKLTLSVIHALLMADDDEMMALARKVKRLEATDDEIARLVEFTKAKGGILYAEQYMQQQMERARLLLAECADEAVRTALSTYISFVVNREK